MKRVRLLVSDYWRLGLGFLGGLSVAATLLLYRLGTISSGVTGDEFVIQERIIQHTYSLKNIFFHESIFLPFNKVMFLFAYFNVHHILFIRGVSVLVALVVAGCFYKLLAGRVDQKVAVLSTLLLVSASWFLHVGRSGGTDVLYLLSPLLLWYALFVKSSKRSNLILLLGAVLFGGLLYIPGFIWLILLVIAWQFSTLRYHFKRAKVWVKIATIGILTLLSMPFVAASVQDTTILKFLLGIPPSLVDFWQPVQNLKNFAFGLIWRVSLTPRWCSGPCRCLITSRLP